jgi:hypothetical protein
MKGWIVLVSGSEQRRGQVQTRVSFVDHPSWRMGMQCCRNLWAVLNCQAFLVFLGLLWLVVIVGYEGWVLGIDLAMASVLEKRWSLLAKLMWNGRSTCARMCR